MKNKKSVFWLGLWGITLVIGSLLSAFYKITYYYQTKVILATPPYANYTFFLLLIFALLLLILLLCVSYYYAVKESNKAIKIVTAGLIAQHVICLIAILIHRLSVN